MHVYENDRLLICIRIWLYDLSRKIPSSVSVTGLDISLDQIPPVPRGSQMPNMRFQQWSFFDAPPAELAGTFDVVHMRLVAVVVMDQDPEKILKNVKMLLSKLSQLPSIMLPYTNELEPEPGGYIQWEEHYTADANVISASGDVTTEYPGLTGMRDLLAQPLNATDGTYVTKSTFFSVFVFMLTILGNFLALAIGFRASTVPW